METSASKFATELVGQLQQAFPPEMGAGTTGRALALRRKAVEQLLARVSGYRKDSRPGFLKRLLFARTFQKSLSSSGYSADFIRQLTAAALVELTKPEIQA